MNEAGGASLAEASGQHPAASLVSGGSGQPWIPGPFGPAISINSGVGYWNAGNILDNLSTFTVSLWFRTSSTQNPATLVAKVGSGGLTSGQGWGVIWADAPTVFTQLSGGSTYSEIVSNTTYNDSKWHHGVFTVSGYVAQKIYIDGASTAITTYNAGTVTTTTNTSNLEFGADDGTSDFWNGSLDLVGIWNRVLSGDEIKRLYVDPFYLMSPGGQNYFSKARIVKKPAPVLNVTPDGITSKESQGAQSVAENLLPLGLSTQEAFGATSTTTNNARNVFPAGIPTAEAEGFTLFTEASGPLGIPSGETQGKPVIGLNLESLGITSNELLGALKTAIATHNPINIPLRRRSAFNKPPVGAVLNSVHPLAQGLAAAWVLNDGGSLYATELVSGARNIFSGSPSLPTWSNGPFGPALHFPGGSNSARIAVAQQPAFTDLGLNGGMSVSFWYNYDAAQLATPTGSSMMGKSDSTDGGQGNGLGFTHGWNINSDNWHMVSGIPVQSGPQYIKLEFECGIYNKQGGIPAPTTAGVWHHIVMTTAGGASTQTTNDYAIYLDGVLQQNIFFFPGQGDPTVSDAGYNLAIGSHPNGSNPFAGYLDTVLLYNRCLTGTEAQRLYTDPFCFMKKRTQLLRATHSTGSLSITPLGIVSGQQLGAMRAQTAQIVSPLGIASSEKLGSLHSAIANIQALYPGAIVSLESLGSDTVIVAVPLGTPANRILTPETQYRIFTLKIEERIL